MRLRVRWSKLGLWAWKNLSVHSAMVVSRAVFRFAETGQGEIEWDPPHHRLSAGFWEIAATIDTKRRILTVIRIYSAG